MRHPLASVPTRAAVCLLQAPCEIKQVLPGTAHPPLLCHPVLAPCLHTLGITRPACHTHGPVPATSWGNTPSKTNTSPATPHTPQEAHTSPATPHTPPMAHTSHTSPATPHRHEPVPAQPGHHLPPRPHQLPAADQQDGEHQGPGAEGGGHALLLRRLGGGRVGGAGGLLPQRFLGVFSVCLTLWCVLCVWQGCLLGGQGRAGASESCSRAVQGCVQSLGRAGRLQACFLMQAWVRASRTVALLMSWDAGMAGAGCRALQTGRAAVQIEASQSRIYRACLW